MHNDLVPTDSHEGFRLPSRPGQRVRLERHGHSPDPDNEIAARSWLNCKPRPWAIDLFCGAGGLSLGLEDAGFSVVAAADADALAVESHAHNIEGLTWTGDLSDPEAFIDQLRDWGIESVDLVAGGPPCQPFSLAGVPKIGSLVREGRRSADDRRADLWRSFFAIIDYLKPRAVLFENVQGFTSAQKGAVLVELVNELESRGYDVHTRVLKASQFGVPQHRSRLFVVGVPQATAFYWPRPSSSRAPTLQDAIGDLPDIGPDFREEEQLYTRPKGLPSMARQLRKGLKGAEGRIVRDHITRGVRPDDAQIYELLKPGDTYADVPEELRRYRSDIFADKYNRLSMDEVCRTITAHMAKDGYWYIHPTRNRTLSVREAARIQTFPDRFRFAGAPSSRYRQIGNAVPPMLAKVMGEAVLSALVQPDPQSHFLREQEPTTPYLSKSMRDDLTSWFSSKKRAFSWRTKRLNRWQILMIEMCLHRTRAEQVAEVGDEILKLGRTPRKFLENRERLSQALSTLGLQWRIDNITGAADYLLRNHGGRVPRTRNELLAIPGVGDYISSAVLCFGFDKPATLVDTNTRRIARRVMGGTSSPTDWEIRLALHRHAGRAGADLEWNQALLDLGATVCTARAPRCLDCPILVHCSTGKTWADTACKQDSGGSTIAHT